MILQLQRLSHEDATQALQIVKHCFEAFRKNNYEKIAEKLQVTDKSDLRDALTLIKRLNPKPASNLLTGTRSEVLRPDFIVTKQHNRLQVALTNYYTPPLKISSQYQQLVSSQQGTDNKKVKEAASFARKKLEAASWFIDAVSQRQQTLLKTIKAIVKLQEAFFKEENEQYLKPMILKHVAKEIEMDISTVSRIVNNKSVQTDTGIYPLKFFFTEGVETASGEDVSNRAIKKIIADLIEEENKKQPYTGDRVAELLQEKGYGVARRTVAKYREQLQLPVARLRREI